jgi:hypothetical protein
MGRYIKNKELKSGSYSIRLPMGQSAIGPNAPVSGLVRYNQGFDEVEVYSRNSWRLLVSKSGENRSVLKDTFYGDSSTRTFGPMKFSYQYGEEIFLLVFIGNVFQNPGVSFSASGYMIEFTSTPPLGQTIVILHGYAR